MTHRTRAGNWESCGTPDTCELLFHIPELSPDEVEALPKRVLAQLMEAVDPPVKYVSNRGAGTYWWREDAKSHVKFLHRDYDLPAVVLDNGTQEWWVNAGLHRENDKPARVTVDGTQEWYWTGMQHRGGDKPAFVSRTKEYELSKWYRHGKQHRGRGKPALVEIDLVSGKVKSQVWFRKSRVHRWFGPAFIHRDLPEWWWFGIRLYPAPFSIVPWGHRG